MFLLLFVIEKWNCVHKYILKANLFRVDNIQFDQICYLLWLFSGSL